MSEKESKDTFKKVLSKEEPGCCNLFAGIQGVSFFVGFFIEKWLVNDGVGYYRK